MCETAPHGRRNTLRGGFQISIRNQTLNEAAARVQLLMLLHRAVHLFPVVQHQAAAEALDLVDRTRVVKARARQAPLGDGDAGREGGEGGHAVELAREVVLQLEGGGSPQQIR